MGVFRRVTRILLLFWSFVPGLGGVVGVWSMVGVKDESRGWGVRDRGRDPGNESVGEGRQKERSGRHKGVPSRDYPKGSGNNVV